MLYYPSIRQVMQVSVLDAVGLRIIVQLADAISYCWNYDNVMLLPVTTTSCCYQFTSKNFICRF